MVGMPVGIAFVVVFCAVACAGFGGGCCCSVWVCVLWFGWFVNMRCAIGLWFGWLCLRTCFCYVVVFGCCLGGLWICARLTFGLGLWLRCYCGVGYWLHVFPALCIVVAWALRARQVACRSGPRFNFGLLDCWFGCLCWVLAVHLLFAG